MATVYFERDGQDDIVVHLRDPRLAALFAWLWPGAGHFYQRRFTKGFLFMICILGTFIYGLGLGRGRVVYASFREHDFRWQYICQAGVGLPSLFALVQKVKTNDGRDPFFVLCERYPAGYRDQGKLREFEVIEPSERGKVSVRTVKDGFMAPPAGPIDPNNNDVLGMWHAELKFRFDLGTLFTVIAGLLNVLAIYDAFAGPAIVAPDAEKKKKKKKRRKSEDDADKSAD